VVVIPDLIGNPEKDKLILDSRLRGNDGKRDDLSVVFVNGGKDGQGTILNKINLTNIKSFFQ